MSEKDRKLEELNQMKNDLENKGHSVPVTESGGSSFPAWLWWGLGIVLGVVSVIVFAAQYQSEKNLDHRVQEVDRKEALLGEYQSQKQGLTEQVAELSSKQASLQEAVDGLQAELKAGSTIVAEYRVIKEEHKILTGGLSDLKEARKQAKLEVDVLEKDLVGQRSEYTAVQRDYTNVTSRISALRGAVADTDQSLEAAEQHLEQKQLALSASEQKLQRSQTKIEAAEDRERQIKLKLVALESDVTDVQRKFDKLNGDVALLESKKVELANVSSDLRMLEAEKKSVQQKLDDLKQETVVYESIKQQLTSSNRDLTRVTEQLAIVTKQFGSQDQKLARVQGELKAAKDTKLTLEQESNELKAEIFEYETVKKRLLMAKMDLADTDATLAGRQKDLSLANESFSKVKKNLARVEAELSATENRLNKSAN